VVTLSFHVKPAAKPFKEVLGQFVNERALAVNDASMYGVSVYAGDYSFVIDGSAIVVDVDPRTQDFFRVVIEERHRLQKHTDLPATEKKRLDKALKVLANAASYGIYAEMHRQEADRKQIVTCHGIDAKPFRCCVAHPDVPGEYCFPPLASLITGAARLMLSLLEYSVSKLGGSYAMEDTDSMAIVATERGGKIPCADGKRSVINALSWRQVEDTSKQFDALNPYDREAVRTSILN
jgi:hypothetical protein